MRYNVGDRIPFISVFFDEDYPEFDKDTYEVIGKKNVRNTTGVAAYMPWDHRNLEIIVEVMNCVSHHKVPGSYDDELKYDGFIFHGNEQSVWHNQYPEASYGQLDDSANWHVSPAVRIEETFFLRRVDARTYLENVLRGMRLFAGRKVIFQGKNTASLGYLQALLTFYHQLRTLVEGQLENKVLIHRPIVFEKTDGTRDSVEDIRDVVILDADDSELPALLAQQKAWEDKLLEDCKKAVFSAA